MTTQETYSFITLSGKKGSGKSSIADLIPKYERISYATPVKGAVGGLLYDLPYSIEEKSQNVPALGTTVRQLFQMLGEGIRSIDPDFWVKHLLMRVQFSHGWAFVIDDLRYPNEMHALRDAGHQVCSVRISSNLDSLHTDGHESENIWEGIDFDLEVTNNCHLAVGETGPEIHYERTLMELALEISEFAAKQEWDV